LRNSFDQEELMCPNESSRLPKIEQYKKRYLATRRRIQVQVNKCKFHCD